MKKIRIYEAAKEFHVSSEALLDILRGMGQEVKSHMSSIEEESMVRLREKFAQEVSKVKEELAHKREKETARAQQAAAPSHPPAPGSPASHGMSAPPRPAPPRPAPPGSGPSRFGSSRPAPPRPGQHSSPPRPGQHSSPARPGQQSSAPRPQSSPGSGAPSHGHRPGGGPMQRSGGGPGRGGPGGGPGGRGRGTRKKRRVVDERAAAENVKQTLARMDSGGGKPRVKRRREREDGTVVEEDVRLIQVAEFITVAELSVLMEVKPQEVIVALMRLGIPANINRRLDRITIEAVADEFEYAVEFLTEYVGEVEVEEQEEPGELSPRAPVVTIMGHVDHGKTTLLDFIRRTNVAGAETGGITQHIGAYSVKTSKGEICFLDTPGHEAFTSMRARGAQVTDIVVLVVAADDRVMPQTVEAIDHARAAGVSIIVAINKVDLPGAQPAQVRTDLTKHGLVAEDFGGDIIMCEVSAKKGQGVDHLLDMILLRAELMDLRANAERRAKGAVVEARVEPGRGNVVTLLVQNGTLHVGDAFVAGRNFGKVRALINDRGQRVREAGPSVPVEVMGFSSVPTAGDTFQAMEDEREAREIAGKRQQLQREQEFRTFRHVTLSDVYQRVKQGDVGELRLIIKADVDGSAEALSDHLGKMGTDEVKLRIIHSGVGNVSESDVLLAAASDAVIIGFRVKVDSKARDASQREKVDIRSYEIIYKAEEEVRAAMSGLLKPEIKEVVLGQAEVRNVFRLSKSGAVAGCYISSGALQRAAKARLVRAGETVFEGRIGTLKRFKEDVKEVASGFECGITIDGFSDYKEGDIIEAFQLEEVARTLS